MLFYFLIFSLNYVPLCMMSAVLTEETKPQPHGLHGKEEPEGRQRA